MAELEDWKDEEWCRQVACGIPFAEAYREVFKTGAQTATTYVMGSRLYSRHHIRVQELRETLRGASQDAWIMGKTELMQYLTRALRTPKDEMGADSDLVQVKITEGPEGTIRQIQTPNVAATAQLLASVAQYTAPQVQSLSLHLHNHETARTNSLEDAAKTLALEFAASSTVIDLEPMPVAQPTPKKTRR